MNLWLGGTNRTYNGDNIEAPGIVNFPIVDVVVDGKTQVFQLLVVDCLYRVGKLAVTTGFHLYKDDAVTLLGDDVNVTVF